MNAELLRILSTSTIAVSAAILVVLVLRGFLRRRFGAASAYLLWLLVPLSVIAVLLPVPDSVAPLPAFATPLAQVLSPVLVVPSTAPIFDFQPWTIALWMLGATAFALRLTRQQKRFLRALGPLVPDGDAGVFRARTAGDGPVLVGAWRPRIVLPRDFDDRFEPAERRLILAHERLHRARGDAQVNLLAALLRCLFWFNPLVHLAASRFRFDQELACDALVIARFPEARRPYADAMLKAQLAAESRQELGLPVGCYWQPSHPLKERIRMLKQPVPGRARRALGLSVALALASGGACAAWAAKPATSAAASQSSETSTPPANGPHASYRSLHLIAYPAAQFAAGRQGVVYVAAHVGVDGKVESVSIANGSGDAKAPAGLAEAALAGVRTWTFNPAEKSGKPVASDEVIPVVFALSDDFAPKIVGATLDAIRIAPPKNAEARAADRQPSENASFRMMHPPKYPDEAIQQKLSARLMFKILVGEDGVPQTIDVDRCDPPEAEKVFAQASIDAIRSWRFDPGLKDGKPYPGYVHVPIDFTLTDE